MSSQHPVRAGVCKCMRIDAELSVPAGCSGWQPVVVATGWSNSSEIIVTWCAACSTTGFGNVWVVPPRQGSLNFSDTQSDKYFFPGSGHFSASLSIAAVQSQTVKRCQSRTANPPVDVHVTYLIVYIHIAYVRSFYSGLNLLFTDRITSVQNAPNYTEVDRVTFWRVTDSTASTNSRRWWRKEGRHNWRRHSDDELECHWNSYMIDLWSVIIDLLNQPMPIICRWHFMWNASDWLMSAASNVR